ncbi:MAG: glycoside hydrolase family 25 protein [Lachnospiraceae bacterium]|nr:glycoside hydrolase family 25 protein [Lachnospiraceae bacterium]
MEAKTKETFKKNRLRKNREKRSSRSSNIFVTIITCLIALASLTGCIFLILENQQLKNEQAEFVPVMGQIEDGVFGNQEDSVRDEPEAPIEINITTPLAADVLDELKERVSQGEDFSAILRALLVDDIVVGADGQFYFFPINDELKKHDYIPEQFVLDDDGILAYQDEDGNIISQKGIDVSRYQLEIDWEKVAADGVDFAIIRVGFRGSSEGALMLDQYYEANIEGALANGIETGVYFFTQALNEEEAIEEAEFVLEHIAGYDLKYPVVIDIEAISTTNPRTQFMTKEEWTDVAIAFCERIKEAGYTPMIYGNLRSFFLMLEMERLEEYEKWFAFFRTPIYFPYEHRIWQYTERGRVDGIEGDVDLNVGFWRFE